MNNLNVKEVTFDYLEEYNKITSWYYVDSILKLKKIKNGLGGIIFEEIDIKEKNNSFIKENRSFYWDDKLNRYIKNYDIEENLIDLPKEFDITNWGILIAYYNEEPAGGAILAYDTKNVNMLDKRKDLTVLWDIRVSDKFKNKGIGTSLFQKAVDWSKKRNCTQMKIETQNINANACKFYAKQGAILGKIDEYAYYNECDFETQLIWYFDIK
jgi:GNAT superfamily N-acetyltransferase